MGDEMIAAWLAIGLAVGLTSKLLYPGRAAGDWLLTVGIGMGAALLDGWASSHLLVSSRPDPLASVVAALAGAVIAVAVYRFVLRRNLML